MIHGMSSEKLGGTVLVGGGGGGPLEGSCNVCQLPRLPSTSHMTLGIRLACGFETIEAVRTIFFFSKT